MRRVVLSMFVSADGYAVEEDSPLMTFMRGIDDEEWDRYFIDRLATVGAHAMGSDTYRVMAAFWPTASGQVAEHMNRIPKLAFTRGEGFDATWGPVRVIRGEAADSLPALKAEEGGDILVHGGVGFVHSLLSQDLFDEFRLLVMPVVAGAGVPVFADRGRLQPLKLVTVTPFPSGSQEVVWQPMPVA